MIHVISNWRESEASSLIIAALRRSVGYRLVVRASRSSLSQASIVASSNPDDALGDVLLDWLQAEPRKLMIFGRMPAALRLRCSAQEVEWPEDASAWSRCEPAARGGYTQSDGEIRYRDIASGLGAAEWTRPLERFDFADEWNNLGYGAIRSDGSIWALAEPLRLSHETVLAELYVQGKARLSYCALINVGPSTILWYNRPVGPIDSFEWCLIERFLSDWRSENHPCCPVISEIPWGYDSAVTMRLDCDEDIASARLLWAAYRDLGVPLSLAINTSNLGEDVHLAFLRKFCAVGGALLSHTATHAPNWGGSYEAALKEGLVSHDRILDTTGVSVDYAVSPFHQSPLYALAGLCDAGYRGCIGGIICNDPEFLIARGGELAAGLPRGFIGHSQQAMLHGDCMLTEGDPIRVFKAAYDRALETRTFFGYLDHPFSQRYQYGWANEMQRIKAHQKFVTHIRTRTQSPLFLDENKAMDFLRARSAIELAKSGTNFICNSAESVAGLEFGAHYRGTFQKLTKGSRL